MLTTTRSPSPVNGTRPAPPDRPGGGAWSYEMLDGTTRVYADTLAELVSSLAGEDYLALSAEDAYTARLRLAYALETSAQASVIVNYDGPPPTPDQLRVATSDRATSPSPDVWDGPFPLVLTRDRYAPHTATLPPLHDPGQIIWVDASTDATLLASFHRAGNVTVASRDV